MKKIILLILIFISAKCFSQDAIFIKDPSKINFKSVDLDSCSHQLCIILWSPYLTYPAEFIKECISCHKKWYYQESVKLISHWPEPDILNDILRDYGTKSSDEYFLSFHQSDIDINDVQPSVALREAILELRKNHKKIFIPKFESIDSCPHQFCNVLCPPKDTILARGVLFLECDSCHKKFYHKETDFFINPCPVNKKKISRN